MVFRKISFETNDKAKLILIGSISLILMQATIHIGDNIRPAQKIALGLVDGGDKAAAAGKALLASRTNTLFSAPMLWGMFAGPHYSGYGYGTAVGGTGLILALVIIAAIEINGLKGKMGPITSVSGVIKSSLVLTAVLALALNLL